MALVLMASSVGLAAGLAYGALTSSEFDLPINATVAVRIMQTGDVNVDDTVDAADLRIVARNLDSSPVGDSRADVDGDGKVDVLDLALVARFFTQ